jgi:hypothetical protein
VGEVGEVREVREVGEVREAVKSINGSPGTRETPAGMSNHIKAPDPCALSLTPFMAQVLLAT